MTVEVVENQPDRPHCVAAREREDWWVQGICKCGWRTRKEFDERAVNVQLREHIEPTLEPAERLSDE